mmetsp:Transcript_573/g.1023  ORF Transcript_573/g.1023 Transcript_573/m.1023 type:complete len:410 (+) Transcript_573:131-1360(+)
MKINLLSILPVYLGTAHLEVNNHLFAAAFSFPSSVKKSAVSSSFVPPRSGRRSGQIISLNRHSSSLSFSSLHRDEKKHQLGLFLDDRDNDSTKERYFYPFSVGNDNDYHINDITSDNTLKSRLAVDDGTENALTIIKSPSSWALLSTALVLIPTAAAEAASIKSPFVPISTGDFNPANFRPVCPASDGIYRFAQSATQNIVGPENFVEYGPLIAGGLLRIRLELCVVESFFNEAVGPFIEREGLRWILPLHETVETFLAGTIFALASTFILVGSTKIVSVLFTYADLFVGAPCRWIGGFAYDRARGKPVTLDVGVGPFKTRVIGPGNPKEKVKEETLEEMLDLSMLEPKDYPIVIVTGTVKAFGETSKVARDVLEAIDLFVGRYLTLLASGYIGIKFLHFKVFPDFPPF